MIEKQARLFNYFVTFSLNITKKGAMILTPSSQVINALISLNRASFPKGVFPTPLHVSRESEPELEEQKH